jgi:rhamnosyltransferase
VAKRTIAVIVTYFPHLASLQTLLDSLVQQVQLVVIVDNGSSNVLASFIETRNKRGEHLISLGANRGIATAQNVGIDWARQHGADYILLFDQDSSPSHDMVHSLIAVVEAKSAAGVPVAAVGPRYIDDAQNSFLPFVRIKGLRLERQPCPCGETVTEVDYLHASGCLIPVAALERVGNMREDFFIDYVDIEWGLRAKQCGLQSFGVCAATMQHKLGDETIEFFGRTIPLHSPLRHYYHFRNAVCMYRQKSLPLQWKLADGCRLFLKYGFYALFAKPHLGHLKMMSVGVWHGLRSRMGILNNSS